MFRRYLETHSRDIRRYEIDIYHSIVELFAKLFDLDVVICQFVLDPKEQSVFGVQLLSFFLVSNLWVTTSTRGREQYLDEFEHDGPNQGENIGRISVHDVFGGSFQFLDI